MTLGLSARSHRIWSDGGRDDESLGIMDNEWVERIRGTFHNCFTPFAEVQYVDTAICMMFNRFREPMPPSLDEFPLVEPGAFFTPAVALRDKLNAIYQVLLDPIGCAVPLDVVDSVLKVNRPGPAVQPKTTPIPHLKGEDIRSRTDLEDHTVFP